MLPIFFVLGLLLSFTPCVLPMVPILSSIIVGQSGQRDGGNQRLTKMRGFVLALAYALGMAIIYTAFGVAAGLAGEGLAAALQRPWVLTLFAALLVAAGAVAVRTVRTATPVVLADARRADLGAYDAAEGWAACSQWARSAP